MNWKLKFAKFKFFKNWKFPFAKLMNWKLENDKHQFRNSQFKQGLLSY